MRTCEDHGRDAVVVYDDYKSGKCPLCAEATNKAEKINRLTAEITELENQLIDERSK
jgi:hypothetical protein